MFYDKMEFGHNQEDDKVNDIRQDKTLKKILKQIEKFKKYNNNNNNNNNMKSNDKNDNNNNKKYEEFIRFILNIMKKRKSDNLLQSTSIWALLSLVNIHVDTHVIVQLMLRAGVSIVLYDMIKYEELAPPTRKYASDLISILW